MRALAKNLEQRFLQSQVGKAVPVLFETKARETSSPGGMEIWQGHTTNYCRVKVQGINLANTERNVHITGIKDDGLAGDLL